MLAGGEGDNEIEGGEAPMKVLVDVVGRTVRITGHEIERLERVC